MPQDGASLSVSNPEAKGDNAATKSANPLAMRQNATNAGIKNPSAQGQDAADFNGENPDSI